MRMKIRRTEEGRRETGEGRGGAAEAWRGRGGGGRVCGRSGGEAWGGLPPSGLS